MPALDALVIGGGPAGATAALLLARAGKSVAVVERATFPRRKVCGEFLAPAALSLLRGLGLADRLEPLGGPEIRRLALWAGNAAPEAPLPGGYARAVPRDALDARLLEHAAACGAQVHQPAVALRLERNGADFVCTGSAFSIEARAVIAAHGSWEPGPLPTQPRRRKSKASDLLAFKAQFRGCGLPTGAIALLPFDGGYAGAVETGSGMTTLACCIRRDRLQQLRLEQTGMAAGDCVLRHVVAGSRRAGEAFSGALREGPWLAAGVLRPGARPLCRDGVFTVGNAAGEVHPLVGEGIAIAMRSAAILCELLVAGYPPGMEKQLAREYQRRWRREFVPVYLASSLFARLAMRPALGTLLGRMPWMLTLAAGLSGKTRSFD